MRFWTKLSVALLASWMSAGVCAQNAPAWPTRPITMVVPYAAGGGLDAIARVVAHAMGEELGQTVIVDNRAGGGGVIGADSVARAAPDGYTVLMAGNPELVIAQTLVPGNVRYDVQKDFVPIMLVSESVNILFTHPAVTASLADILAGKAIVPGGISVGTPGQGTPQHIALEVLRAATREDILHVPYRGGGPAVLAVMGGQTQFGFVGAPPVLAGVNAGKLRALAVNSAKRSALAPDVPTIAEATGIEGTEVFSTWYGLLAPRATPTTAIHALQQAMSRSLARQDVRDRLAAMGTEVLALPQAAFAERIRQDIAHYVEAIPRFSIKSE